MLNENVFFTFSSETQNEIYDLVKSHDITNDSDKFHLFRKEVEEIRDKLENGEKIVIIKPLIDLQNKYSILEQRKIYWILANLLGDPINQNEAGDKSVLVYDRDKNKTVEMGARYHQTHEGGIFHTDNVNVPFKWHYLLFACISPSYAGGESIIVSALKIQDILKKQFPNILKILEQNFLWEQRGMADTFNEAPIITYKENGEAEFRYLRPYLEAAHIKHNLPLAEDQIHALDTLDALLNHSDNQFRHTFSKGEILLTYDSQILHDRSAFSDDLNAVTFPDWNSDNLKPMKRTMDRIWIKKRY
ncbi:MAG: TauD/TfdA family dioxygenase [Bacteriovorax sp.]|nr:TauD/TfdA family dioxygenase [Bacteriovorax sp.]